MKNKYVLLIICLLCMLGCNCGKDKKEVLADSPENRKIAAAEIISQYSTEEWKTDIFARIEQQTGKEVAKSFSEKIQKMYSPDEIAAFRVKLLTETFTANELNSLAHFMKLPDSKSAIKKFYLVDEKLKAAVSPELTHTLSGDPQ